MVIKVSDLAATTSRLDQDPAPSLTANLNLGGNSIVDLTGPVTISGLGYPSVDGVGGSALVSDGNGVLSLSTAPVLLVTDKGSPLGLATLNAAGKVPDSQVPSLAITDTFVVNSEAEMLGLLFAQRGDLAVRNDADVTYILRGVDPSALTDWQELPSRSFPVTTVFSRVGDVVAQSGDYNASQVTYSNTSSGLVANTVQASVDEIVVRLGSVESATSSALQPSDNITQLTNNAGYISGITAESIGDLSDVNLTSISPTDLLTWNGTNFVPVARTSIGSVSSIYGRTGAVVAQSGDYNASQVTYSNATSGLVAITTQGAIDEVAATSGSAIQPSDNITQLTNNAGYISGITAESIGDLSDVDLSSIANGKLLKWATDKFVAVSLTTADITDFNANDFATSAQGVLAGSALQPSDNITQLTNNAGYISGITAESIGDLSDVNITGITTTDLLTWNGTNFVPVARSIVGSVSSIYGRTGAVVAQSGDYNASQVTYSNATSGLVAITIQGAIDEVKGDLSTLSASAVLSSEKAVPLGVATLGADGKVLASQIPTLAVTKTTVVASQADMLGLTTAETGDLAVRMDVSKTFILRGTDYATLSDWQELLAPTSGVSSVAGKTGVVALDKTDVGLANVDNTSDLAKPVSTATSVQLATKASKVVPSAVGNVASLAADGGLVDAGYLASEVIRSGQNISLLANDANYITVVGAPVQSVNGLTGTVVLDADDISVTGTTNKFTTQAAITKLAGISTGAQLNTASNVGSGQGVYVSKVGSDLRFKSIVVSPVLSVSSTATEITLGKTAVVFNAHCGGVVQTVAQNVTVNALFGTIDTTHANYSYSAGVVTLSAAGVYEVSADITINANVVTVGIRLNGATQNGTIASAVGYSGAQTATTRTCRTFNAGSQISIAITGINGQITTVVNGCRILIRRIA